jgi:tRNA(adenine34) deaminase
LNFDAEIVNNLDDLHWMQLALQEADAAALAGEVPVGAVVVKNGVVVATGRNQSIATQDPTAHAEVVALRAAAQALGNYRLEGCSLYVTLEPCIMCCGAMLHARLEKVVFGARDPRTGAAGSLLNVFTYPTLNHQTRLIGGVLEEASAQRLRAFFKPRRINPQPLREDALRTPNARFENLPKWPWSARYINDLPSLQGLRMHYLDEGPRDAPAWLCLHDAFNWSYFYREVLPVLLAAGQRVIVPDLPGFGRSDKLKRQVPHALTWFQQILSELLEVLSPQHLHVMGHGFGGLLALTLAARQSTPVQALMLVDPDWVGDVPPRMKNEKEWKAAALLPGVPDVQRHWKNHLVKLPDFWRLASEAPYPDPGYWAAPRSVHKLVLGAQTDPCAALLGETFEFMTHAWQGQGMVALSLQRARDNSEARNRFLSMIGADHPVWVMPDMPLALPTYGAQIAQRALSLRSQHKPLIAL